MEPNRVAVAMSGGVDSGVAAQLLSRRGMDVFGVHMRVWIPPFCGEMRKKADRNARDAEALARFLGIPFHVVDVQEAFRRLVVEPFAEAYLRGRTPNPCVVCNPTIKLGVLMDFALGAGASALATGHYARILHNPLSGRWELHRSADRVKDQSYYLHALSQEQLARFLTPVGGLTKDAVRELARRHGLPAADRKGSQEICFVPDDDYRGFLDHWIGEGREDLAGPIVDGSGKVLGRHKGIHHFTVGQRRGIGISSSRPLYVIEIRPEDRAVVVGPCEDLDAVGLETGRVAWGAIAGPREPMRAWVRIRYRSPSCGARITPLAEGEGSRVFFDKPQRAVTPGQSAVFYDETDEYILGGGVIERAIRG
jgi:tRNA-specific 2-thiouridylase